MTSCLVHAEGAPLEGSLGCPLQVSLSLPIWASTQNPEEPLFVSYTERRGNQICLGKEIGMVLHKDSEAKKDGAGMGFGLLEWRILRQI